MIRGLLLDKLLGILHGENTFWSGSIWLITRQLWKFKIEIVGRGITVYTFYLITFDWMDFQTLKTHRKQFLYSYFSWTYFSSGPGSVGPTAPVLIWACMDLTFFHTSQLKALRPDRINQIGSYSSIFVTL